MIRKLIAVIGLMLAGTVSAGNVCDQGAGNTASTEWQSNISARRGGKTTEVAVTNGAGGTAVPATALSGRKAIEIQNLGPNPIFCTVDGTAPVVNTNGRRIDALGTNNNAWALDVGPSVAIKCIAATAAQVSGAATMVTELK